MNDAVRLPRLTLPSKRASVAAVRGLPLPDSRVERRSSPGEATGRGRLVARREGGRTVLSEARATSPLRFVVPTFPAQGEAGRAVCLVTFGGGLVDGDLLELDVVVEDGATLVLFTQASTKVFRGTARQSLRASVRGRGTLVVLPDPVACFAGASYEQLTEIELAEQASCVVLDGVTSGRPAYGERWAMDRIALRTRVRRGGQRILDDALVLDARDAAIAPRMLGYDAWLTVMASGPRALSLREALLDGTTTRGAGVVAATSPLGHDGAVVRVAGPGPDAALAEVRRRLRNLPDIDAVDTFGARR